MSEHEFEIYLSVLSKLLRLNPAQKAAISDELRDHLEERLAALVQTGMSREAAVRAAMDEFGDVTGLALDLTRVSRTPLRKVLMRSTIVASVTALAIVCWVTLFVPEHRIAAPPAVQAQFPVAKTQPPAAKVQGKPAEKQPPNDLPIAGPLLPATPTVHDGELFPEFLAKPVDADFVDAPLLDVSKFLQDTGGVPVMLHRTALEDAGVTVDTPVNVHLAGLTFEEILDHVTGPLKLTWQVDSGVVRITSPENARYLRRQFDLQPLVKLGHSTESLLSVLHQVVGSWEEDGEGDGTQALVGETVVVRQTYQNQRRIAQVLAAIEQQKPMAVLGTCTGRDRLLAALQSQGEADFVETPLADVISILGDMYKVPILLDAPALSDAGIAPETQITMTLKERPLGKLLELLLDELHLTIQIRDGVIRVTTKDQASYDMMWVVYNVHDFAGAGDRLAQLTNAILDTTSGRWEVDGDNGRLALTEAGSLLLVRQTDQVQFEIQDLIEQLRRTRKDPAAVQDGAPPRAKLVTKSYRLSSEIAADLHQVLPKIVAPQSWNELISDPSPMIELITSTPLMDQVDGIVSGGPHEIRVINPPKVAPKPGAAAEPARVMSMVIRPRSSLVIRQSPQVHAEIQKFLSDMDLQVEVRILSGAGHGGPSGGGGFMGGGMGGGGGFMGGGMGGGGGFF